MDLVAEMLLLNLADGARRGSSTPTECVRRWCDVSPGCRSSEITATAETADRILNRVWDYPRWLRSRAGDFDLFHIIDHSYAHLALHLPAGRSLVTCHDLDAFRGVLPGISTGFDRPTGARPATARRDESRAEDPVRERRHARRAGLGSGDSRRAYRRRAERRASLVQLRDRSPTRIDRPTSLLGPAGGQQVELLHVGSTIPRKRIDVLLNVVAALRRRHPGVRLIQGRRSRSRQTNGVLPASLGLDDHVTVLPFVERRVLAAIYRRAALVLQPSDREGFGLPVAEAMTCGTPVVASDLPALREVGGPAATYCPVGDVERWVAAAAALLEERANDAGRWRARQAEGIDWARRFDWQAHARATMDVYREVLAALASDNGRRVAQM